MDYTAKLDEAKTFDDVYRLVKQAVQEKLGLRRAGMGLILADLPNNLAAFHEIGSNSIVLNKILLNAVSALSKSKRELNSYVFVVLLHEYLHTLGIDEYATRELVKDIVSSFFPAEHIAVKLAATSLYDVYPQLRNIPAPARNSEPELVKDFDTDSTSYIG
ncbi:hypothetical protein HRbin01_01287 [archaeon HR01]|nr:hypothetical protein HRbin01_01287 [archaeon HR01]